MPKDISERRRVVVEKAYSLLGKVNYFWGGKSSAIGWDSRWGNSTRVTAAGSRTTGTIRPYGLDCTGFVDWVFNNSLGYVIGHGGGAVSQHDHCRPISWSEAQPGDLVFYPGDTHVGVFVGKDSKALVSSCSATGSTKAVAEIIADELNANLYEITPVTPYASADLNGNTEGSRVNRAHKK